MALGLTGVIGIPLLLALATLALLQHDGAARWAAQHIANAVNPYPGSRLTLGEVSGTWVTGLELRHVRLVIDGDTVLAVDTLRATYDPLGFATGAIAFREVHLAGPSVRLRQLPDSSWDLLRPFAADSAGPPSAAPGTSISIAALSLTRGAVAARFHAPGRDSSLALDAVELRARDLSLGRGAPAVRIDSLSLIAHPPASPGPVVFSAAGSLDGQRLDVRRLELESPRSHVVARGSMARPGAVPDSERVDFTLEAAPLAYEDFGPFVPGFDGGGEVRIEMTASGTAAHPAVRLRATFPAGGEIAIDGEGTSPRAAALAYRGSLRVRALDPARVTGNVADSGRVDADVALDLAGTSTDSLTGAARFVITRVELRGIEARNVVLEAPFDHGRSHLGASGTLNGMRLDGRGWARPFDSIPTYDLRGELDDVARFVPEVLHASGPVRARFEISGRDLPGAAVSGRARLALEPRDTAASTSFRGAVVSARLSDSAVSGNAQIAIGAGEVIAPFVVSLDRESVYRVQRATIRRLDPSRLLGATFPSNIDGTLSLEGRGFDPRALAASLTADLHGSWGGYDAVTARITGSGTAGTFRGEARVTFDTASVQLGVELRPFAATPSLRIDRFEVASLDLAKIAPDVLPASRLTATATLEASGADLARAAERVGQPAIPRPLDVTLSSTVELAAGQVGPLELRRANLTLGLVGDSLRFDGAFEGPAGIANARGAMRLFQDPIAYRVDEARFVGLDLQPFAGPALPTDLNGRAVLAGRGTSAGHLTLDGEIQLDSSVVRSARLGSSRMELRARGETVTVRGRVTRPHGTALLSLDADVPEGGGQRRVGIHFTLDDTLNVNVGEPLPAQLTIDAELADANRPPGSRALRGTVSAKGSAGSAVLDSAYARFEAARGWLTLDTAFVVSPLARVEGAGHVAIGADADGGTSDLEITARLADLAPLAPLVGARVLGLDSARVDARVRGRSDSLGFAATARAEAFVLDEYRLGSLSTTAHGWLRSDRSLGALEGTLHAGRARVGFVDLRLLQGEAVWDGEGWAARGTVVIDDRRQMTAVAHLDPRPDVRRLRIESLVVVAGGAPWGLSQPVEARYGDTLAIQGFVLASRDGRISLDGRLDGTDEGHLRAELRGIPLGTFSDLIGFPQLAGRLDGSIDVTGTVRAPRATGQLVAELRTREALAATWTTTFTGSGGRVALDMRVVDRAGGSLTLAGSLPRSLAASAPNGVARGRPPDSLELRLTTGPSGLRLDVAEPFLDPRAAADLRGSLVADARLAGTPERPQLSGEFALRDARLRIPTLGVVYDSISGRALLSDSLVRFQGVRVVSGGGSADLAGVIAIGRGLGRRFDLTIGLSGFNAVATSSYQATLSGQVRLHGVPGAPHLEGTVAVRDAQVNLSTSQATANVERVELTPADLRTLERRFGYGLGGVRSPFDGIYDALTLDLTVQLERNTWLRHPSNPQVVLELVGRVRVRKLPQGDLLADGTIEILPGRSYVEQFGARFEVSSGSVVLAGRPEELHFNVKTRHEAGTRQTRQEGRSAEPAVVITMDVEGTADEIRLTLASEPELTDTEIISYLATGRLPNWTPGGGQQEGSLAADIALRQVSRNVQGALEETLPLDVVEIRSDGLRGLTLVAGRYTSPRLYLGVKQPVSFSTNEHTSTTAAKTTEFEVEYEAYRWLLMNLQGGATVLRFFLKTHHDY